MNTTEQADQAKKRSTKRWYDQKVRDDPIDVGEEVLVFLPEDSTAQWHSPYVVLERTSPLSYKLSTPDRGRKTRQFHHNLLKRYTPPADVMVVMVADEEPEEVDQLDLIHLTPSEEVFESEPIQSHLNQQQKEGLENLLLEFDDVFCDTPGKTDHAVHHIKTGIASLINQLPYRIPMKWRADLEKEVDQLLEAGSFRSLIVPGHPQLCV